MTVTNAPHLGSSKRTSKASILDNKQTPESSLRVATCWTTPVRSQNFTWAGKRICWRRLMIDDRPSSLAPSPSVPRDATLGGLYWLAICSSYRWKIYWPVTPRLCHSSFDVCVDPISGPASGVPGVPYDWIVAYRTWRRSQFLWTPVTENRRGPSCIMT